MVSKEGTRHSIEGLLQKFKEKEAEGRVEEYNEEQIKQYFIMPLFRMLGWDIENEEEVVPEAKASKGWVDYAFKINGISKFYVEVKKPSVDLNLTKWAKQAVDYAYHKGVTWVILTNFRELKIFNSEIKKTDPTDNEVIRPTARWQEYATIAFEKIWFFSKEAIINGELDREADKWGIKTKRIPIDKALLNYLVDWREKLSKDIVKNNPDLKLSEDEIDEVVQRLLDRFIFIRKCEDLQLEEMKLWPTISMSGAQTRRVIHDIQEIFKHYEKYYDSDLFKESLADKIIISGDLLEEIIKGLHRTPDNVNYDFAFIEADILGSIYEQYLGHILKKTKKGAKLGESKAHRKEQGIYYTPTYVVDYIVKNTLGELIKDKTPAEIRKIKVLDPACGSGSFLIKAFDATYNTLRKKEKVKEDFIPAWQSEILTNNIYGVDLDQRAVEIARLNLMLKTVEKGKRLPLLEKNIKCGNSLIDDEKIAGNKTFKWGKEFSEIMKEEGFDVVIGNPPYVNFDILKKNKSELNYYKKNLGGKYKFNLYTLFIIRSLELLKDGGYMSFILPNSFSKERYNEAVRKLLLEQTEIRKLVDFTKTKFSIFEGVSNDSYTIFVIHKVKPKKAAEVEIDALNDEFKFNTNRTLQQTKFLESYQYQFTFKGTNRIVSAIKKHKLLLKDICLVRVGLTPSKPYKNSYGSDYSKFKSLYKNNSKLRKYLNNNTRGDGVFRYRIKHAGINYIVWDEEKLYADKVAPGELGNYDAPKLIMRNRGTEIVCSYDEDRIIVNDIFNVCVLKHDLRGSKRYKTYSKSEIDLSKKYNLKVILAIINSKITKYYLENSFVFRDIRAKIIEQLPIPKISPEEQQALTKLVDNMLSLNKSLNEIGDKQTSERARLEEEIKRTDGEIDELVYKLYGVTEEEKKLIEESLK